MSILNAFVYDDHALVGVDTEAMLADGSTQQVCKLIVAPQLSAVAGFRGLDYLQMVIAPAITGFKGTFDQMAEHMPANLEHAIKHCQEQFGAEGDSLVFDVVLVGWSESAQKMTGHAFIRKAGSDEIEAFHGHPTYIAPLVDMDEARRMGISGDRAGMATLALHQCQLIRREAPESSGGGRFFIAEARRNSISINQAFEFPPRSSEKAEEERRNG